MFRGKIVNIVQKDGVRLEENDISGRQQLVFYKDGIAHNALKDYDEMMEKELKLVIKEEKEQLERNLEERLR